MISRRAALLAVWTAVVSAIGPRLSSAQHLDVLVQQAEGRLVTGSANFDTNQRTLGRRVFFGEFDDDFAVDGPGFNALGADHPAMPAGGQALPANAALAWEFLPMTIEPLVANLFYWNGLESNGQPGLTPDDVLFGPLPGPNYSLSLFDKSNTKSTVNGSDAIVPGGIIGDTAADGSLHWHRYFLLEDGDGSGATSPADGIYLLAMQLRMASLANSEPLFMVFGTPGSSVAALDSAAVPWVEQHVDTLLGLAGDYNGDGSVDAADYVVWRATMGQIGSGLPADGNRDHSIDSSDYEIWKANFGKVATLPAGAGTRQLAVPEPGLPMIVVLAVPFALSWRRKRNSPLCRDTGNDWLYSTLERAGAATVRNDLP